MKILLVDDDATNRLVLNAYLKKGGHDTLVAENGQQAVEVFQSEHPDMVLMDVMMPIMDGYEATVKIKSISEKFIPIIFLTAMTDEKALAKCVEVGGDDFLTKPYSRVILNAKIEALSRVSNLYNTVYKQRDILENYNIQQDQEQRVARNVFNSLVRSGCLDLEIFHKHLSPVSLFNGDVVLASMTPSGNMHVLFGDFTGHGLSAALGSLPVSETFYAMVAKNYGIEEIAKEINKKLKAQLPVGIFLACCMIEIDVVNSIVKLWNGAIPGAYILRKSGQLERIESKHLPFAILSEGEFSSDITLVELFDGDRLVLSTDGILEAENTDEQMYGTKRFEESILKYANEKCLMQSMMDDINEYTMEKEANDDITLAVIDCDYDFINRATETKQLKEKTKHSDWDFNLTLQYDAIKYIDPLPIFNQVLTTFIGKSDKDTQINMSLSEMFCNSLDHGLLGLNSSLKATPQGFMEFFEKKTSGLQELQSGYISMHFSNKKIDERSSHLTISFEDSGAGFDVSQLDKYHSSDAALEKNKGYSGRGYPLIKNYTESLKYNDKGNKIECVFKIE